MNEIMPEPNEGLPDSSRISGLCPRCNKQCSFETTHHIPINLVRRQTNAVLNTGERKPTHNQQCSPLICNYCKQGTVVIEELLINGKKEKGNETAGTISWRGIYWWPLPNSNIDNSIPDEIANCFDEANRAKNANCLRASAVMARTTLEAITDEQGFNKGKLYERLKNMKEEGKLNNILAEWAKEIRLIGNDGAHFDPIKNVSTEDSDDIINFTSELLNHFYVYPSKISKRRNKRQQRNSSASNTT